MIDYEKTLVHIILTRPASLRTHLVYCVNTYCYEIFNYAETMCKSKEEVARVSTQMLIRMMKGSFPPNMSKSNIGAMLKRCTIFLNTQNHLYFRLAGTKSAVERHVLLDTYLLPGKGAILYNFKKFQTRRDQDEVQRLMTFEKRLVNDLLQQSRAASLAGYPSEPTVGVAMSAAAGDAARAVPQGDQASSIVPSPVVPRSDQGCSSGSSVGTIQAMAPAAVGASSVAGEPATMGMERRGATSEEAAT